MQKRLEIAPLVSEIVAAGGMSECASLLDGHCLERLRMEAIDGAGGSGTAPWGRGRRRALSDLDGSIGSWTKAHGMSPLVTRKT